MFGVACKERVVTSAFLYPHRISPYFVGITCIYSLFRPGSAAAFWCKSAFDGLVQGGSTRAQLARAARGQGISDVYVMIPLIRRCSRDMPYLFVLSSCACLLTHCRCQCLPSWAGSQRCCCLFCGFFRCVTIIAPTRQIPEFYYIDVFDVIILIELWHRVVAHFVEASPHSTGLNGEARLAAWAWHWFHIRYHVG